jgi:hypothetical protein
MHCFWNLFALLQLAQAGLKLAYDGLDRDISKSEA